MTSFAEALNSEAAVLEVISTAPLPDLNTSASHHAHHTCSSEDEMTSEDIALLCSDIEALLDEESRSKWALDSSHVFGNCTPDIRQLELDASEIKNDKDGNEASLYWYIKCMKQTQPDYDLSQDPIYHDLADRVAFGFSLSAQPQSAEDLAEKLHRSLEMIQRHEHASSLIQRVSEKATKTNTISETDTVKLANRNKSKVLQGRDQRIVVSHSTQTMNEWISVSSQNPQPICLGQRINPPSNRLHQSTPIVAISHSETTPEEYLRFMDGFLAKVNKAQVHVVADSHVTIVPLSSRCIREILRPLALDFVKTTHSYGITDPAAIVDVINSCIASTSGPLTSVSFSQVILGISLSLSEGLVDQMGGKEAVMQASSLLFMQFVQGNTMSEELRLFLRDVSASCSSRTCLLFLGRLLEKAGSKVGQSALQVVETFVNTQKGCKRDIPQAVFLNWLASLKPKFSTSQVEHLLSDISSPNDSELVSMQRFIQMCIPPLSGNAGDLKRRLSYIFSACVVGSSWLHQVMELCKEKDINQSGLIGWKEFLEALDEIPVLLTSSEAQQLASLLADKVSLIKVKYSGLGEFVC